MMEQEKEAARDAAEEAFLEELTELCQKHGFCIESCGCCQSPWVLEKSEVDRFTKWTLPDIDDLGWKPPEPEPTFDMNS